LPTELEGVVRMPVVYEPWYVYKVTLVASPASFEFFDLLFPDASGLFDRNVTDDDVLDNGYCFALEKFVTGMTEVQVAAPGSAVPMIASGVIQPFGLVKFNFAAGDQSCVEALAADLAAGKVIGRLSNHHKDHENIRVTAANDVVIIRTGLS
jgi:hypothetical protein